MWSRNLKAGLAALAIGFVAAGATADEVEMTPDRENACADAEVKFKEDYSDYKVEPGVVLVKVYKYNFCPVNLTVKKGTRVRWLNIDKRTSHSVWMKDAGIKESERFFPEEMFEFTFQDSGPYPYLCGPHWETQKMRGFVRVSD